MRLAFVVLAFCLGGDKFEKAAQRVHLPDESVLDDWSGRGDAERRVVLLITDRGHWARALRTIEEKLGFFNPECDIRVRIEESDDAEPARGSGRSGRGVVVFNMRKLAEYMRKVDEYRMLERSGKLVKWVVPPVRMETVITHELTHVFCGSYAEKWLTEGIASYVAGDPALLYAFNHRRARVGPLDGGVSDDDAYGRGMAFFAWLEAEVGREGVHDFADRITNRGNTGREAAEAVTGRAWARIAGDEKAWSETYLERFKPGP